MSNEQPRFYPKKQGYSWAVYDREIQTIDGYDRNVGWFSNEEKAQTHAEELNRTRGHAKDEPRCVNCGGQPASGTPPRCGACHSRQAYLMD